MPGRSSPAGTRGSTSWASTVSQNARSVGSSPAVKNRSGPGGSRRASTTFPVGTGCRPGVSAMTTAASVRRHVVFNAGITALGGLLFGYDTGMISGAALLFIGRDFPMSSVEKELLASSLLIGAAVGAPGAGKIADKVGRRPTVLGTAALFVVGVALAAFSPSYVVLLVAGW